MCCWPPAPRRRWCTRPRKRQFSRISGAVVINIGTLSQPWLDSMLLTAQAASQASVPWVLDPVAHHATALPRGETIIAATRPRSSRWPAARGRGAGDPVVARPRAASGHWRNRGGRHRVDYVTDGRAVTPAAAGRRDCARRVGVRAIASRRTAAALFNAAGRVRVAALLDARWPPCVADDLVAESPLRP